MIELVEYPDALERINICIQQINRCWPLGLAKWEVRFLKNIKRQVEDNKSLMPSQENKLTEIMNKIYRPTTKGGSYGSESI